MYGRSGRSQVTNHYLSSIKINEDEYVMFWESRQRRANGPLCKQGGG